MKYTTKTQLIEGIETERATLDKTLALLTPEQYVQQGIVGLGEMNIKDVLAHLAVWCSRAITLLFEVEQGAKPTFPLPDKLHGYDALNHADWLEQRERPLDRIQADFNGTHAQLIKRLDNWRDDAVLFDPKTFSFRGRTLAEFVWGDAGRHDAEHAAAIAAFVGAGKPARS